MFWNNQYERLIVKIFFFLKLSYYHYVISYGEIFWLKLAKILFTNFIVDISDLHPSSGQFAFTMGKYIHK